MHGIDILAHEFSLPRLAIVELQKIAILPRSLSSLADGDRDFLLKYSTAWGRIPLLRLQCASISKRRRAELIEGTETAYLARWERYVYLRFLRLYRQGASVTIDEVEEIVATTFRKDLTRKVVTRLKALRKKAYDKARREKRV